MRNKLITIGSVAAGMIATVGLGGWVLSTSLSQPTEATVQWGTLWLSALTFVTAGWALVALVWTFHEQRKLTVNVSRAYLELTEICLRPLEGTNRWIMTATLKNNGHTPALDVGLLEGMLIKGSVESGPLAHRLLLFTTTITHLPPQMSENLTSFLDDPRSLAPVLEYAAWQVDGTVSFTDTFGEKRRMPLQGSWLGDFPAEGAQMQTGRGSSKFSMGEMLAELSEAEPKPS